MLLNQLSLLHADTYRLLPQRRVLIFAPGLMLPAAAAVILLHFRVMAWLFQGLASFIFLRSCRVLGIFLSGG